MKHWHVVNTLPHQEERAELNLNQQGYEAWCPRYKKTRRHARKFEEIRSPLFPGYLFIHFDPEERGWSSVNGTFGVRQLITHNGRPAAVPEGVVEEIWEAQGDDGLIRATPDTLSPGDRVQVTSGPFAGGIATLLRLDGKDRVQLLLDMLGSKVRTTLAAGKVIPVR